MSDPSQEKEYGTGTRTSDPVAFSNAAAIDEPLDVDGEEKDFAESTTPAGASSEHSLSEKEHIEKDEEEEKSPDLKQTKSYATTNSAVTGAESKIEDPRKPWYKQYNPLRWGKIPPVPESRKVCREYNAPFLSLVYFQWVAPLMSVCSPQIPMQMLMLINCAGWL